MAPFRTLRGAAVSVAIVTLASATADFGQIIK